MMSKIKKQDSDTRDGTAKRSLLLMASAALATLIIYSPARKMPFFFDDRVTIVQNRYIQSPSLKESFKENPFRAVPNLTFALQARLHSTSPALPPNAYDLSAASRYISSGYSEEHGRNVAFYTDPKTGESIPVSVNPQRRLFFPLPPSPPFHLGNLLLHMINALLLLVILRSLAPDSGPLTAAAALAFLLHPLATEPVNYATARFTLLSSTFCLLAVAAHLRYEEEGLLGKVVSVVFFILALFSKESAAALPLLVFLLDAARGRVRLWVLWGLFLSCLYAYLRVYHWPVVTEGPGIDLLPRRHYLLIQQRMIWLYLLKILIPIQLNFDPHVAPDIAIDSLCAAFNLILLIACGCLVGHAAWSQLKIEHAAKGPGAQSKNKPPPKSAKKKEETPKREPAQSPPLLWAAAICLMAWISVAPSSSIIPLGDLAKEDRAYTMLIIIVPALALGAAGLARARGTRKKGRASGGAAGYFRAVPVSCPAIIILCLGLLCFSRNTAWKSELSLTKDMLLKSPMKPRARYQYATALKWSGRYKESLFWYQRVISIDPGHRDALVNIEVLKRELAKGVREPD